MSSAAADPSEGPDEDGVRPRVVDAAADSRFRAEARAMGRDPDDLWVGGYVDYEWLHLRPILRAYGVALRGVPVLEFGCNYGASGIVMAAMGGQVCGVDVDARAVGLARLNAARHGRDDIDLRQVADTRQLPFADGQFGFVLCNSVLEYVAPDHLPAVIGELHRVLQPDGLLLITGTSSRISPREVHSRRWLVNWLPRALDRLLFARAPQRGLDPLRLRRLVAPGFVDLDGAEASRRWLAARGGRASALPMRLAATIGGRMGVGAGWFAPSLSVMLRRKG